MGGDKLKVTMQRHGVFRLCCLMAANKKPAGISQKLWPGTGSCLSVEGNRLMGCSKSLE